MGEREGEGGQAIYEAVHKCSHTIQEAKNVRKGESHAKTYVKSPQHILMPAQIQERAV